MKEEFNLMINGQLIVFDKGKTILQVCRDANIPIPTLCNDQRLKPYGGCRLCLVELEGMKRPLASCTTPAEKGMVITTESPRLTRLRRTTLELLLSNHPNDCMCCEATGSCDLQELAYNFGVKTDKYSGEKWKLPLRQDNPFITFDPNKCIVCGRCVRICNELVMAGTISVVNRGFMAMPDTAFSQPRSLENCEFCGQCVSTCPTGALCDTKGLGLGRTSELTKVRTTCTYCGTGCNFFLNVKNDRVIRVTSDFSAPVNHGNLCIKGRYGYDFIHHDDRIKTPLIKENGTFRAASWDEALQLVATRFKEIIAKHGAEKVGGFSSSRCSNEENYLLAKWVRCAVGSNNVDNCARVCHAPTVAGLATSFGAGAATNSLEQMPDIDTIFIIGSNTTEGHPIVSLYLKQAISNGAKVVVADPRNIWLAKRSDVWLNLKPGSNIALLNGMIRVILENGWENKEFIATRTEGFAELKAKVAEYDLATVERLTGVTGEKITLAARLYALAEKSMVVYGLGVTEHRTGTENAMAIANLALVCGQIGRPSTGIMALRGQNNVQGASDLGPLPGTLPGYQAVTDPASRAKFEKAWSVKIKEKPGLKSVEMLDECAKGNFKALYILGEDPGQTDPDITHIRKALENIEFLVVQDIFPTETTKYAHVVLPGASFAEKDGTFTNGERRVQRIRRAVTPVAGLADWEVICRVSTLMGYPMPYRHPSEIMDEIATLVPAYGGINYARIEEQGIQWPCPTKDHPGTTTLYTEKFARPGGLAQFMVLDHIGSGEVPDENFPMVLITGRVREHYNNGSQTRHAKGIVDLVPEELVEISPEDALALDIHHRDWVKVSSVRGEIKVRAKVTDRSQAGNLFMTFHHQNTLTNILTSGHRCRIAGTPEYKSCAVKVEPWRE
jgi:formate dehydrogenase (NADP+) alpha subunit